MLTGEAKRRYRHEYMRSYEAKRKAIVEPKHGESNSIWIGDKENGIELRPSGDEKVSNGLEVLDELVLYIDGKCVLHMEAMSKVSYWFGFYLPDGSEAHMNVCSKNLKAHLEATAENQG